MQQLYNGKQGFAPGRGDAARSPPFYSSQLPPDRPHGMQGVIGAMNQSRKITLGHITPKMPKALSRKLNSKLDIYDTGVLCNLILRYCGFGDGGLSGGNFPSEPVLVNDWVLRDKKTGRFIGDERMVEYAMLLQTFQILHLSYEGMQRDSGNEWMTHPLRAALFVAALGAPVKMVVSALLHDILEDAMDPKMPTAKFRAFVKKEGQCRMAEYTGEEEILGYIRGSYWRYGIVISEDVRHDTRKQKINSEYLVNPALYERLYKEHLRMAHARMGSAFAKAGDTKANSTEINSIRDPGIKRMKFDKRLLKLDWQLDTGWSKLNWHVFESLLSDLQENSADEKAWERHRFVPAQAIWSFSDGYNLIGKPHRYIQEVRDKLMPSRSPTIEIYIREGKPCYTFEFPFINDSREAIAIVKDAFGKALKGEPERAQSLLPQGIRDATLVSAEFFRSPEVGKLNDLAAAYDEKLDGRIEGGFNRQERTKAAWDRHHRMKSELKL
ncbi:MAG: hypothetical protein WC263_03880 [Candidatus Micrarchaeia archaeon]|jgi:hypothetical protein